MVLINCIVCFLIDIYIYFMASFLWMGFNCLKATATLRKQFTFYYSVPRNSWYSFYRRRKDERLSQPWNHPVVLNMGPLDWESSTLTTSHTCKACVCCFLPNFYFQVNDSPSKTMKNSFCFI